jgi:hypothetical protein
MLGDQDDLDDRNRASSTAFSRTDDPLRGGDFRQIYRSADLDVEALIQTGPDAGRSGVGARQNELDDGWYGHPSSMRDGQRRIGVSQNAAARRDAADRIFASRGAMSRNVRSRSRRVPALDGILHPPGGPGGKADRFQIVFLAETLDAVERPAAQGLGIRLAGRLAEAPAGVGLAI